MTNDIVARWLALPLLRAVALVSQMQQLHVKYRHKRTLRTVPLAPGTPDQCPDPTRLADRHPDHFADHDQGGRSEVCASTRPPIPDQVPAALLGRHVLISSPPYRIAKSLASESLNRDMLVTEHASARWSAAMTSNRRHNVIYTDINPSPTPTPPTRSLARNPR